MSFVADLHLHSSHAYATSPALNLENLCEWAGLKGIDLLATADWTHPAWFGELKEKLEPGPDNAFKYVGSNSGVRFVLGTEISCVFHQGGKGRRVHLLLFVPDLETAEGLRTQFAKFGNLIADGRPTLKLSVRDATELAMNAHEDCLVVPAHAWTPWYGIYGSRTGFDRLSEAFGDMTDHIPAIETGLSSDPEMNWAVPELNNKTIVSFSDAHSLPRLGREVTVFRGQPGYTGLAQGLRENQLAFTVEMYPEEGKYHYDGHRKCGVTLHPRQTATEGTLCPQCGRTLTLGVLHRTRDLGADSPPTVNEVSSPPDSDMPEHLILSPDGRRPFVRTVPLLDIMSAVRGQGAGSKGIQAEYRRLVAQMGSEMSVLLWATEADLSHVAGEELAEAIIRVRRGEIVVTPGYDGVYGRVSFETSVGN